MEKEKEPHYFVEDDLDSTTNCGKLPEFNLSEEKCECDKFLKPEQETPKGYEKIKKGLKKLKEFKPWNQNKNRV